MYRRGSDCIQGVMYDTCSSIVWRIGVTKVLDRCILCLVVSILKRNGLTLSLDVYCKAVSEKS